MNKLLLTTLFATGAFAIFGSPLLQERQLITIPCEEQGLKDCGEGCINLSWTCCPSGAGGCGPTEYCNLASNGQYNCCPRGRVCDGPGGATTFRSTNTVLIPGETSTVPGDTTTFPGETSTIPGETTTIVSTTTLPGGSSTIISTSTATLEPTTINEPPSSSTLPPSSTVVVPPSTYTTTIHSTMTQPSATPIPLPTPIDNGTSTSTSSIAIINAGAANGYSSSNMVVGLLAGAAALLI
ncbi:hypothetical protein G7046_g116 [Stylonectria norvegica]|nr:hypothetical protein G7046_g116 [Stylonectria norvegica]